MRVRQVLDTPWVETISVFVDRDQRWVTAVTGPGQPAQTRERVPLRLSEAEVAALLRTATREGPV